MKRIPLTPGRSKAHLLSREWLTRMETKPRLHLRSEDALWEFWWLVGTGRCRAYLHAISVTVAHLFCLFPLPPKLVLITLSFSCQERPVQWVMQQQQPGACPGLSEAGRRGMKSKEDVWVMEKSTSSSPVPYIAKPALVTPNTGQPHLSLWSFNHLSHCSCNSR